MHIQANSVELFVIFNIVGKKVMLSTYKKDHRQL